MRRVISVLVCIMEILVGVFGVTGCSSESSGYEVDTADIFYSIDSGKTYCDGPVIIGVGESAVLMVVVEVESNDGKAHSFYGEVRVSGDAANVSYLKGQSTEPVFDEAGGVAYPFEITTNEECRLYLEVVPNCAGCVDLELTFDDSLPDKYDVVEKIKVEEQEVEYG